MADGENMLRFWWHGLGVPFLILLTACTTSEPFVTASTTQPRSAPQTDQAVIAEVVGASDAAVQPLAWANPSTGSAGVIQQIEPATDADQGCRKFVTTHQTITGSSSLNGIACPSQDNHWKISR